jgi:tetratricopeptide (TPR) repeat protein
MELRKATCALMLVVFIMGMLPVTAAQPPKAKDKALVEKYKKARAEYTEAVKIYKNARSDYRAAMHKFKKSKKAEDSKAALNKGKAFLLRADTAMIMYLKMLRTKVDKSRGFDEEKKQGILKEIDGYTSWLENRQEEIDKANNLEDLKAAARSIREKWGEIRWAARRISGEILTFKIDTILSRAEALAEKVETKIPELQDQGVDTVELEGRLSDFHSKIELAKEKNAEAKEKFRDISSIKDANKLFREGHVLVKEANNYIREAYKDLKMIIKAYKRHTKRKVEVNGTGRLTAHGDGKAYLKGNGTITVSILEGAMIVSKNATVETSATGNRTELGDGEMKYQGFEKATIRGEQITLRISGKGIDLVAEGTGKVRLTGKGTYTVCGYKCLKGEAEDKTGNWTAGGVRIIIAATPMKGVTG